MSDQSEARAVPLSAVDDMTMVFRRGLYAGTMVVSLVVIVWCLSLLIVIRSMTEGLVTDVTSAAFVLIIVYAVLCLVMAFGTWREMRGRWSSLSVRENLLLDGIGRAVMSLQAVTLEDDHVIFQGIARTQDTPLFLKDRNRETRAPMNGRVRVRLHALVNGRTIAERMTRNSLA